jgi:AcrR family transcriptional regulator
MVYSAAQLVRAQGVSATGLRQVIEEANAPRGSFQHYFPGGKDQLVGEAIGWAGGFAAQWVTAYRQSARRPSPAGLFAHIVKWWKEELAARDFERGCPVMATSVDAARTTPRVHSALLSALDAWEQAIVSELVAMGVQRRRSRRLATLMLSSLEGAIMLARVRRDLGPLDTIVTELRPVFETQ